MKTTTFCIVILSFLSACNSFEEKDSFDPSLFSHDIVEVSNSYQGCELGASNCTYIKFSYPEFQSDSSLVNRISDGIKRTVFEEYPKDPNLICDEFIEEYEIFAKEEFGNTPYEWAWYQVSEAEVLSVQKRVISVSVRHDSFLGGAHPNLYFNLLNFSPNTGEMISYKDIFSEESQGELVKLLEHELRKQRNLKKKESLNENGFWLPEDKLILSENFAFTDNGLLFIYNSYEIAPYAMGIITITLPYGLIMHLFE